MYLLDKTFPEPRENLSCDEALLDMCENGFQGEILRFWEPRHHFVVLGFGSNVAAEVDVSACWARGIPLLRRYSGGATVLQGPGCLNYTLILRIPHSGPLSTITGTTRFVMERNVRAIQPFVPDPISVRGYSDLTIREAKFSGNAQRRKHRFLLFHGTLLLNFDISLAGAVLLMPARQPDYRRQRPHVEFMTNLGLPPDSAREALRKEWDASLPLPGLPETAIRTLATERYAQESWTFRR